MKIKKEYNANIYVGLHKKNLYFAINKDIDIFKIDLKKQINEEMITDYYNEFQELTNVIFQLSSILSESLETNTKEE